MFVNNRRVEQWSNAVCHLAIWIQDVNVWSMASVRTKEFIDRQIIRWKAISYDYPSVGFRKRRCCTIPDRPKYLRHTLFRGGRYNDRIAPDMLALNAVFR